MRYGPLGTTGCQVSKLVLGTVTFGELIQGDQVDRVVGRGLDLGINAFDTGDVYANGLSEELLGKAVRSRRDDVLIMTKVGFRVGDDPETHGIGMSAQGYDHAARWSQGISPNESGLSRVHVIRAVEDSLRRLDTDWIDLYQVHYFDYCTPIEETLSALDDLVHAGKVRYVGCSSFAAWQLLKALWVSERDGLVRFSTTQVPYNLLRRDAEHELLPACVAEGVGALVFQAMAGGLLTGRYDRQGPEEGSRFATRPTYMRQYWNDASFNFIEQLGELAATYGVTTSQLALAWVLHQPGIAACLVGAEQPSELDETTAAVDIALSAEQLGEIASLQSAG